MAILITLTSLLGIAAIADYAIISQRCKNNAKGYGKKDLKEILKKGLLDQEFIKN